MKGQQQAHRQPSPPPAAPVAQGEPIIVVESLRASYGSRIVLRDISFAVLRGEIFGILGGSGSGKSTLLKHLIGLYRPDGGRILIEGADFVTASGDERQRLLRSFGVSYQQGALFGDMTLAENVRLPLEEFTDLPGDAIEEIACLKLGLVGLSNARDALPSEISGGMLKRAAIARAMALDPKILFLDEPSAGLDPVTSAEIDQLIRELRQTLGITFVMVTHELASIFATCDRVIVIDRGRRTIIAEGPPAELRDHSDNPIVHAFFHREPLPATAES